MSAPVKETINWVTDGSLPDIDDDDFVLVNFLGEANEFHYVWPGFHDGDKWRSVDGFPVSSPVAGWAYMPIGTKAEADPEIIRLKTDAIQMRAIIGEQGAMINRLQVMLQAAQEAAAQASGLIVADAIAKACR